MILYVFCCSSSVKFIKNISLPSQASSTMGHSTHHHSRTFTMENYYNFILYYHSRTYPVINIQISK